MARIRALTVATSATAVALAVTGDVVGRAAGSAKPSWGTVIVGTCAVATSAGVGALIGIRRPGHPVGLLLALTAFMFATVTAADGYARFVVLAGHDSLPAGSLATVWTNASWPLLFAGVTVIAFVFPDGRLPSRRWRAALWVTAGSMLGTIVLALFSPGPFDPPFHRVANSLPVRPGMLAPLELIFLAGMGAGFVAAVMAVRSRYKRATGLTRQQIRWLAFSAWLIPLTLLVCFADIVVPAELDSLILALVLVTVLAVPASIGVAIMRFRLYELDRLVNRTLVYGVLTGCIIALYGGVVLGLGRFVDDRDSLVTTLVATGAVVVAVNPWRSVLQRWVDRVMYGDRRDPYAGLSRLATRLETSVAPQSAIRTIVDTVAESLKVPFVAIDLVRDAEVERMATHGTMSGNPVTSVPLAFQGEPVGTLVVESRAPREDLTAADHRLLSDLARHAGPVVHAIALTVELQRSRERLVVAQEDERRALRRDLHDGLGPVLANAVFQVDVARDLVSSDPQVADRRLEDLRGTLQGAVADIRGLAYALRPPALDHRGLVSALTEDIIRLNKAEAGPSISLAAPTTLPPLPAAVEIAAYRITLEAVTNAVRHSGARACTVRISVDDGLSLEVTDDGHSAGAEAFQPGVGMSSMTERAHELGTGLHVERLRNGGTRVRTVLPLEAR